MKILLVSHGDFAQGLCATMTEFFGATNVYSACVTAEGGTADLKAKTDEYLAEWGDEQVVICSDLKGGSANQTMIPYMSRPNTFLISGMNLSLVMQLTMEDEVTTESLHEMMEAAVTDMFLMNEMSFELSDDDE